MKFVISNAFQTLEKEKKKCEPIRIFPYDKELEFEKEEYRELT